MCSPPLWEPFQLHLSSLAEGWDNTACWATCTQPSSRAPPGPRSTGPESLLGAAGGPSAPGPSTAEPLLALSEPDLPQTHTEWSHGGLCLRFPPSQSYSHGHMHPGRDTGSISKLLFRPRPHSHANRTRPVWESVVGFVPRRSPGWNVGPDLLSASACFPSWCPQARCNAAPLLHGDLSGLSANASHLRVCGAITVCMTDIMSPQRPEPPRERQCTTQ